MTLDNTNWQELIKVLPICIAFFDKDINYVAHSDQWLAENTHTSKGVLSSLVGYSHYDLFPQIFKERKEWVRSHQDALKGKCTTNEVDFYYRPGVGSVHIRWWVGPWKNSAGEIIGCVMITEDISNLVAQDSELKTSSKLFNALVHIQEKYISGADIKAVFDEVLTVLLELSGSKYGFIGEMLKESDGTPYLKTYAITNIAWNDETRRFYDENAPDGLEFRNLNTLFGHTMKTGELVISNDPLTDPRSGGLPKGHPGLNAYLGLPIFGREGMIGLVGVANKQGGYLESDARYLEPLIKVLGSIIEASRTDARLHRMAMHDHLTHLSNRVAMETEIANLIQTQTPFALLYVDLDRFKNINDVMGHHVGDQLLKVVSRKMIQLCRSGDMVSRAGGDEFAVVLKGQTSDKVVADFAQKLISLLQDPVEIEGQMLSIGCCIGIAMFPVHGGSISTLMRHADFALYKAKDLGSGQYHFYDKAFSESHVRRIEIESKLLGAIQNDEMSILYQPIVDLSTLKTISFEALVRWVHPSLGMLAPYEFVEIAEDIGVIDQLEMWVIKNALKQYQKWRATVKDKLAININLSPQHLSIDVHGEVLLKTFQQYKDINDRIIIEITESAFSSAQGALDQFVDDLIRMGIKVAVDDFGTGHSTLYRLRDITAHSLKIDASFVRDIVKDQKSAMITKSLIALGHNLGMKVVAEGVETKAQLDMLIEMGCDFGQGYLFSKPMRAGEVSCDKLSYSF